MKYCFPSYFFLSIRVKIRGKKNIFVNYFFLFCSTSFMLPAQSIGCKRHPWLLLKNFSLLAFIRGPDFEHIEWIIFNIYAKQFRQQLFHKCCRVFISVLMGVLLIHILQGHSQPLDLNMPAISSKSLEYKRKSLSQLLFLPGKVLKGKTLRQMLQRGEMFLEQETWISGFPPQGTFFALIFSWLI